MDREDLAALVDDACPPDILGLNYYVTSDRFLDERWHLYPSHAVGDNGRHRYADVEAVRVRGQGIVGHQRVLERAWQRYRVPVALTEVHLGCTVDEQIRWLVEAWNGARWRTASTSARSRRGRSSAPAIGTRWSPSAAITTSPAPSA